MTAACIRRGKELQSGGQHGQSKIASAGGVAAVATVEILRRVLRLHQLPCGSPRVTTMGAS